MRENLGVIGSGWQSLFWSSRRPSYPSAWHGHVSFMHWLICISKPRVFVELGTEHGISFLAACHAAVLSDLDICLYAVDTWQGDAHTGSYDDHIYRDLSGFVEKYYSRLANLKRCTFDEALPTFSDGSIDILHIDGLHTYEAVKHDFVSWRPKVSERGIVLFHDISVRTGDFGVWRLWDELRAEYPSFSFEHSAGLGVILLGKSQLDDLRELCSSTPAEADALRQLFERSSEVSKALGLAGGSSLPSK